MRRLLAILLLMIVPLQFAWSAVQGVHGHLGGNVAVAGFHAHDGDHAHQDADPAATGGEHCSHNDDGHHDGHCHPAFSMILIEPQPALADLSRGGAPASPPAFFTSHTPPLFDWPPSARR